jgi:cytosine/adenosine deaminase-related metal-dependent hydrolase
VHTSQQLARGIADDVDLMTWLHGRIWPYESNMTEDDSYISTLLCGIELIHSGVSTHRGTYILLYFFLGWGVGGRFVVSIMLSLMMFVVFESGNMLC